MSSDHNVYYFLSVRTFHTPVSECHNTEMRFTPVIYHI